MNVAIRDRSDAALALMARVLRDGQPLAPEYPLIFEPDFTGRVATAEDDGGEVVAACSLLVRELLVGERRFTAGLIGSVCTDHEHRGQGYGSELLASAERELAAEGALLTLLWADEPTFYEHRGYVPVGAEDVFLLAAELAPLLPPAEGARPVRPSDTAALHALYASQPVRVARSEEETAALLAIPGVHTLVLEREGRVVAYACQGRGRDLANTVHEWAGQSEDVLALVGAHLAEQGGGSVVIMMPPAADLLRRYLEIAGVPGARGNLGMAKLVAPERAAELLTDLGGPQAQAEPVGEGVRLSGPAGTLDLSPADVLLTLLPPQGERGVITVVEQQTGLALPDLPLEPYIWGLDSI